MTVPAVPTEATSDDAVLVRRLLAIDPHGLGGVVLRGGDPEGARQWLGALAALLGDGAAVRRMPGHISDDRLLGGVDLAATLAAGRRVASAGLLAEADGGIIVAPGTDRLTADRIAHLAAALDTGTIVVEREGLSERRPARFGLVALDDGLGEGLAAALADRLAFVLDMTAADGTGYAGPLDEEAPDPRHDLSAVGIRARSAETTVPDDIVDGLARAAVACGIISLRIVILAVRCARVHAALEGRLEADERDAEVAARLVLGPRMIMLPQAPDEPEAPDNPPPPDEAPDEQGAEDEPQGKMEDRLLEAVAARLPADLLAELKARAGRRAGATPPRMGRRSPEARKTPGRGRPRGTKKSTRRGQDRLDLIATLRAAAPWQAIRRGLTAEEPSPSPRTCGERGMAPAAPAAIGTRILVRPEDFHVKRLRHTPVSVTIFVVDASGSSALNRLAEAKGAVELLLADCYVRRDEVALIAFRGKGAEVLLPPTRSLVRAKRRLAGLPGGGATPIAAGLEAASQLAGAVMKRGHRPIVVLLTDGRANMSRDGEPGRARAETDAIAAARHLASIGPAALVIDTSPRPEPQAEKIAAAMAARYLPLPRAGASGVTSAVLDLSRDAGDRRGRA